MNTTLLKYFCNNNKIIREGEGEKKKYVICQICLFILFFIHYYFIFYDVTTHTIPFNNIWKSLKILSFKYIFVIIISENILNIGFWHRKIKFKNNFNAVTTTFFLFKTFFFFHCNTKRKLILSTQDAEKVLVHLVSGQLLLNFVFVSFGNHSLTFSVASIVFL